MSDPIEFAYAGLDSNGTITRLTVFEGAPVHENHVINLVEAWGINIDWEMAGSSLLFPPYAGTHWELRLFLESIGPGGEFSLPAAPVVVPWGALASPKLFTSVIAIPAGIVTTAGPYKLTFMLQLFDGALPLGVTGFVEGPVVVFYTA
jgi:hypothetical protein